MTGSRPPIRLFSYTTGRGGQHAQPLYDGIKPGAVLMSDGYEVYNTLVAVARSNSPRLLGACTPLFC